MEKFTFEYFGDKVIVEVDPESKCGAIHSTLYDEASKAMTRRLDGMDSLLLALACEGFDLNDPRFKSAVDTSLDAIFNQE